MPIPAVLRGCLLASATLAGSLVIAERSATAGPAPGLCTADTRASAPADFAIDACIDGDSVWLRNNLGAPIGISATGAPATPVAVTPNGSVANLVTRAWFSDPWLLLPGDIMRIPIGAGGGSVQLANTEAGGFYALSTTVATFIPAGAGVQLYEAVAEMIAEVTAVYGQYRDCIVGKNWIGRRGCEAGYTWDITYAFGRAAVVGLARGALAVLLDAATFVQWAAEQPRDIATVLNGTRTLTIPAQVQDTSPGEESTAGSPGLSDDEVRQAQRYLNVVGAGVLTEDGRAGPRTIEAVSIFQSWSGLATTGVLDRAILDELATAAADQTSVLNCGFEPEIRPDLISLGCVGASWYAVDLVWEQWSHDTAVGSGALESNVCEPSCADSTTYDRWPLRITLSGAEPGSCGRYSFTSIRLEYDGRTEVDDVAPLDELAIDGICGD